MSTDATPPGLTAATPEVMASVERGGTEARVVIADISQDGAWLSADSEALPSLEAWR